MIRCGVLLSALLLWSAAPTVYASDPPWTAGTFYARGDRVFLNEWHYICNQSHTAQVGFEPPNAPALWVPALPPKDGTPFEIIPVLVPAPKFDFDEDDGWVVNPRGLDNTDRPGAFEQALPQRSALGTLLLQRDDAVSGGTSPGPDLVTGAAAGAFPGANSVYGSHSILSPPQCLPYNATTISISFSFYLALARSSNPPSNLLRVSLVTPDGGTRLATIVERQRFDNTAAEWETASFDMLPFAGKGVAILIEVMNSDNASIVEAAVDDMTLQVDVPPPAQLFVPIVDVTTSTSPLLDNSTGGPKLFTLSSILNDNVGRCAPAWGGSRRLDTGFLLDEVAAARGAGNDVVISFGGAGFTDMAANCNTVDDLAAWYQIVIDHYGATHVDFDLPAPALADPRVVDRRNKAISTLKAGRCGTLDVSYTLPVTTSGLLPMAVGALTNAKSHGVVPLVNIAAQDFGGATNPPTMAQKVINAANATVDQLSQIYPGESTSALRLRLGITPMIGHNHVSSEVFGLSDARKVVSFARAKQLGRLSFWSINRDRQCPKGVPPTSPFCSGVSQAPLDFTREFLAFP
jgi:hypothetical protein